MELWRSHTAISLHFLSYFSYPTHKPLYLLIVSTYFVIECFSY